MAITRLPLYGFIYRQEETERTTEQVPRIFKVDDSSGEAVLCMAKYPAPQCAWVVVPGEYGVFVLLGFGVADYSGIFVEIWYTLFAQHFCR